MALFRKQHFNLSGIYLGHHEVTYKGVPALKCPFDYVIYQMIVTSIKPDLIIEIGTNKGGSALYLADLLELNKKGQIHTIDTANNKEDKSLCEHNRIKIFRNGFENYDTSLIERMETILVIEDGSHNYEDCLAAMKKFAPLVTLNSYLIIEDGIIDQLGMKKQYRGGPAKAIKEFIQSNQQFTIDRKWCDFFGENATFNTNGYLKRIA